MSVGRPISIVSPGIPRRIRGTDLPPAIASLDPIYAALHSEGLVFLKMQGMGDAAGFYVFPEGKTPAPDDALYERVGDGIYWWEFPPR